MLARMQTIRVSLILGLVAAAGVAHAQQRRGFFAQRASVLRVATVPAVATTLSLTDEQTALALKLVGEDKKQRDELFQLSGDLTREERIGKFRAYNNQRQATEKQLGESIGPDKLKRIRQLSFQADGIVAAFFNWEVGRELELTIEQRRAQGMREMRDEFSTAREDAEALAKVRKKVNERLAESLTEDQKAKWKEMLGEPADDDLLAEIRTAVRRVDG